jgi:hypothetical protein
MTTKNFDAILAKNQIAELVGELYAQGKLTNGDRNQFNFNLSEIEKFTGEGNQPNWADSYVTGREKVRNDPSFYGLREELPL